MRAQITLVCDSCNKRIPKGDEIFVDSGILCSACEDLMLTGDPHGIVE